MVARSHEVLPWSWSLDREIVLSRVFEVGRKGLRQPNGVPGYQSDSCVFVVKPFGPNHFVSDTEPPGPEHELPNNEQRPALAEQLERMRRAACVVVPELGLRLLRQSHFC